MALPPGQSPYIPERRLPASTFQECNLKDVSLHLELLKDLTSPPLSPSDALSTGTTKLGTQHEHLFTSWPGGISTDPVSSSRAPTTLFILLFWDPVKNQDMPTSLIARHICATFWWHRLSILVWDMSANVKSESCCQKLRLEAPGRSHLRTTELWTWRWSSGCSEFGPDPGCCGTAASWNLGLVAADSRTGYGRDRGLET